MGLTPTVACAQQHVQISVPHLECMSQSCHSCVVLEYVSGFTYWHPQVCTAAARICRVFELSFASDDQLCTTWMPWLFRKGKDKTTPVSVNWMRSSVLYQAAQGHGSLLARQVLLSTGHILNVYVGWVIVCWPASWVTEAVSVTWVLVFQLSCLLYYSKLYHVSKWVSHFPAWLLCLNQCSQLYSQPVSERNLLINKSFIYVSLSQYFNIYIITYSLDVFLYSRNLMYILHPCTERCI